MSTEIMDEQCEIERLREDNAKLHRAIEEMTRSYVARCNENAKLLAVVEAVKHECDRLRERCDFWQNFMEQVGPGAYCHAGCKEAEQRKRIAELTAECDRLRDQLTAIQAATGPSDTSADCAR